MTLHHSASELLDQLKDIIKQISPEDFKTPVEAISGASIGQHIRHTIEFFVCLMDGRNNKVINYDQRKHDVFIETDPKLAISVIESTQEFLDKEGDDFTLDLEANYEVSKDATVRIPSSFYRELAYNIEHAIHHMALIKVALTQQFQYVELPQHFGVASSTIRYQQTKN